jgi:hypothetical protein
MILLAKGASVDNTPIARQVYITSDKDITISVGLIFDIPCSYYRRYPYHKQNARAFDLWWITADTSCTDRFWPCRYPYPVFAA